MKIVILAGGYGTRLSSIVRDRPKPMALIHGKPFLEYQIEFLKSQGFSDFVICVGYKHEKITEHFRNGKNHSVQIQYSIEKEHLGTGGAIKNALSLLEEQFIVINGDSIANLQYDHLIEFHNKKNANVTMVFAKVDNNSRYGSVVTDGNDMITSFSEKIPNSGTSFVNMGIYLFNKNSINWQMFSSHFSLENDLFPALVSQKTMFGFKFDGYFVDIGIPEDFIRLEQNVSSLDWLYKKDFNMHS